MRILIKGGIWKNTEDEILKAAIMKYGKNQWARVSSLLNRKSAKQCKARWYEWLDPSIKKAEWSKEEEEKLLHLAKLMPNQWRTIAPIVGRTAGQCMEHYERLLDQAQEGLEGISEDPRKLRPGEIDPTPELRPARPDPIDMDDDEKEMLSEARARLANTMGKKAKRKARERMLDESRRMSMLQKRRELKAAGIESHLSGPGKRKYIDYAKEIPFQQVAPAGFYDVEEENIQGRNIRLDPKKHGLDMDKLEGRLHVEEEKRSQARDKRKINKLFKEDAPALLAKLSQENDPSTLRRRTALSLPAPQVSDQELEDIVKVGQSMLMAPPVGGLRLGGGVTQSLVGDYSHTFQPPTPTPMRTPLHEDMVKQEARNQRLLRDLAGPFALSEASSHAAEEEDEDLEEGDGEGREGVRRKPLHPTLSEGTGFEGINPRKAQATPNLLVQALSGSSSTPLTVSRQTPGGKVIPGTPGSVFSTRGSASLGGGGATPLTLRDQLGLNRMSGSGRAPYPHPSPSPSLRSMGGEEEEDPTSLSSSSFRGMGRDQGKGSGTKGRLLLAERLKGLPEPEFTYDFQLPAIEGREGKGGKGGKGSQQQKKQKLKGKFHISGEGGEEEEEGVDSDDEYLSESEGEEGSQAVRGGGGQGKREVRVEDVGEEEEEERDWEVEVGGSGTSRLIPDAADLEEERGEKRRQEQQSFWKRQTRVIQRAEGTRGEGRCEGGGVLPRPSLLPPHPKNETLINQSLQLLFQSLSSPAPSSALSKIQVEGTEGRERGAIGPEEDSSLLSRASALINLEMASLVFRDEIRHPSSSSSSSSLSATPANQPALPSSSLTLIQELVASKGLDVKSMLASDPGAKGQGKGKGKAPLPAPLREMFDEVDFSEVGAETRRVLPAYLPLLLRASATGELENENHGEDNEDEDASDALQSLIQRKRTKKLRKWLSSAYQREREEEMRIARELIHTEFLELVKAKGTEEEAPGGGDGNSPLPTERLLEEGVELLKGEWENIHKGRSFLPTKGPSGQFGVPENRNELLSSLQAQFYTLKSRCDKDGKKINKLEAKFQKLTAGYQSRSQAVEKGLLDSWQDYHKAVGDFECYSNLFSRESLSIEKRLNIAKEELKQAQKIENEMQEKFARASSKARELLKSV